LISYFTERPNILETDRLLLRELTAGDAEFTIRLLNTPGWLKYIGDRNVKTREQALAFLEQGPFKSYRENGFGLYLVETKDSGCSIGMCGIIKRPGLETPDIGFAFLPEFTGLGFAYEIAKATLKYALEVLEIPAICAIALPENNRSISLLEKLGLQYSRTYTSPQTQEELLLFISS
jgi:RimJ/RimL family protein N-acetyltransferase